QYHLAGLLIADIYEGIRLLEHGPFCLIVRGIFFQEVFICKDSVLIFFLRIIGFSYPEVGVWRKGVLGEVGGEFFKFLLCLFIVFTLEIYLRIIVELLGNRIISRGRLLLLLCRSCSALRSSN